jgi:hypothetical protein
MKKFILFIITILVFISCSEDIYLHDGNDGIDGTNGTNGKNGYSVSMFNDAIANMTVYYWDRYDRGGTKGVYDSADTIIYRQNNSGVKVIQNIDGSYNIINISGTTETITGTITNGKDAHSPIFGTKDVYDTSGKIIGFSILTYWDMDNSGEKGYGILSDKDILKFISPAITNGKDGLNGTNGKDGSNGVDGKSPVFSADIQIVGNNIVYTMTLNGVVKQVSVPIPQDGKDGVDGTNGSNGTDGSNGANGSNGQVGLTPSVIVTVTSQSTNYLWYADFNNNNICDEGERISYYIVPINSTEPIVALTLAWDFIGSSASYISNGFVICGNAGFSDGLVYLRNGSITTPIFRNNLDLLSLTFKYASSSSRSVRIIAIMNDNSEEIIGTFTMPGIVGFNNINDYSKYKSYEYYALLDNIQFKNVKRIKIDASSELKCAPSDFLIKEIIADFKDNNVE